MSATLIKLASSHRLSPVDGWGKNGPSGTDLVASLLAGANARYHSRSPLDFSFRNFRIQHFPQGVTEPTLALRSPFAVATM
jgi:hypothetical protein